MKLLFASDLHGSAYFTEKLIDATKREQADKIILLGDYLNHGPRNALPKGYDPLCVATLLNKIKENIIAIRGNCDSEVDQMLLAFPMMSDNLPIFIDNFYIFASHGHIFNYENHPPLTNGNVFIQGHTHLPVLENKDGILLLNPGSVSIPRGEFPNSYMIYENKTFFLKDLEGTILNQISICPTQVQP